VTGRRSGRRRRALLALAWASLLAPADARAQAAARRVAFTYDDLPANSFRPGLEAYRSVTGPLLEGLVRHGVPAIGFVNESKLYVEGELRGERVRLLEAWVEAGLELGNHSYSHPDLHSTPLETYQRDVLRGEEVTRRVMEAAGRRPRFFRHPFLHTGRSADTRAAFEGFLAEHGYRVAPVTIDNQEWIFARAYDHALARGDRPLADRIAAAYLEYMERVFGYYETQSVAILGYEVPQILLLHANRLNADTVDDFVAMVTARGYEIIPIDEALEDPAYARPDGYDGPSGITWLHRWALADGKQGEFFAGEPEVPAFVQEAFDDPPRAPAGSQPASSER